MVALAKVQLALNEIEGNQWRGRPESQRWPVRPGPPAELYPILWAFAHCSFRTLIPDMKVKVWSGIAHVVGQIVQFIDLSDLLSVRETITESKLSLGIDSSTALKNSVKNRQSLQDLADASSS